MFVDGLMNQTSYFMLIDTLVTCLSIKEEVEVELQKEYQMEIEKVKYMREIM